MQQFNLDGVEIDRYKRRQLEEFLSYILSQKKVVSYNDMQRVVGLSRQQCEILRINNAANKALQWSIN